MDLKKFNGRKVRIVDDRKSVFQGYVSDYIHREDNDPARDSIIIEDESRRCPIEFFGKDIKSIKIMRKEKLTMLLFPKKGARFPGITWICDGCDECLNIQEGFNDLSDFWKCTKCGYINSISDNDILDEEMLAAIRSAIDEWDPFLFFPDAPADEYNEESCLILAQIKEDSDEDTIASAVASVFSKRFDEHFGKEECVDVAKKIKSNIENINGK